MLLTPISHQLLKIYLLKNLLKNTINNNDSMSYLHQNFRQSSSTTQLRNTTA